MQEVLKTRRFALAVQLRKSGVITAAAALADPASWAPGGVAATTPAVAALYADFGVVAAHQLLSSMQHCVVQGAPGKARTTAVSLELALRVGAASPPHSIARGVSAVLLSFSAVSQLEKDTAVSRGALTWLVQVAAADDTFSAATRCRALAGAGNIAIGARDAAQLAPLQALVLHLLRPHAALGFDMLHGESDGM